MAPDWEKLAKDWEKHVIGMVAEIDCTDPESEGICQEMNVEGFPTLLYGDPSAPEEYQGGRDYETLSAFAKTFLDRLVCGVSKTDNCSDEEKSKIAKVTAMTKEKLLDAADSVQKQIKVAQNELDDFIEEINVKYEAMTKKFSESVESIKEEADYKYIQQALIRIHGVTPQELDDSDDEDDRDEL
jgi:ElaB/YqjD/DUF883 family membrane-anchored ribosome-binding protein